MPQIFSVTVNSTEDRVISRNSPPMVSYDSYRLTYPRMLYWSMHSEMEAICEANVLDVRENTSQQLSLPPNLGKVGIIHYQTHLVGTLPGVTSGCYPVYKAARKAVQYLPPVDVHISQKAVEHVFVAHEQLTEHTLGVVPGVLDGEEREQDRQTEDLLGRELAVLGFGKPHLSLGNLDMVHHVHHSLNRFRIITFRKKAADF